MVFTRKCSAPTFELLGMFYPCIADGLQFALQFGFNTDSLKMSNEKNNNTQLFIQNVYTDIKYVYIFMHVNSGQYILT